MTGPEHYREAEQLLTEALTQFQGPGYDAETARKLAAAQVHATLAAAAAAAAAPFATMQGGREWARVVLRNQEDQ